MRSSTVADVAARLRPLDVFCARCGRGLGRYDSQLEDDGSVLLDLCGPTRRTRRKHAAHPPPPDASPEELARRVLWYARPQPWDRDKPGWWRRGRLHQLEGGVVRWECGCGRRGELSVRALAALPVQREPGRTARLLL